jgi:hypothetical protein
MRSGAAFFDILSFSINSLPLLAESCAQKLLARIKWVERKKTPKVHSTGDCPFYVCAGQKCFTLIKAQAQIRRMRARVLPAEDEKVRRRYSDGQHFSSPRAREIRNLYI